MGDGGCEQPVRLLNIRHPTSPIRHPEHLMRWMWIDRVIELRPREKLVAVKNVSLAEEHLHDHFAADPARSLKAAPVMPASLILEGMAQTAGILVGHAEDFREKVILAKINRAELSRDATPGCTLR